jgi:hypothetical protein
LCCWESWFEYEITCSELLASSESWPRSKGSLPTRNGAVCFDWLVDLVSGLSTGERVCGQKAKMIAGMQGPSSWTSTSPPFTCPNLDSTRQVGRALDYTLSLTNIPVCRLAGGWILGQNAMCEKARDPHGRDNNQRAYDSTSHRR